MDGFSLNILLPDDAVKMHTHRDIELLYGIEGVSVVNVEEAAYRLEPEQILLINAGKKHSIRRMTGTENTMICFIHLSEKMLCEYTGQYRLFFYCNSTLDHTQENYRGLRENLNGLLIDYMGGKKERYFLRYSECYALLHQLLTYFLVTENTLVPARTKSDEMDARYEDILHYIEMYYDSEIGLQDLAETFSLSVSYLSRYLKKKLGMTYTDYLYEVRMRYAVEELLFTAHPLTRIALDHGFPSASVFSERFKAKYHCTPSEYREKMAGTEKNGSGNPHDAGKEIRERLKEHFGLSVREEAQVVTSGKTLVSADMNRFSEFSPPWGICVNAGHAASLRYADMRKALISAREELGLQYVRIWDLFDEELHIIKDGKWGANSFSRINECMEFLLDNRMKPFIELGEKPRRIQRSADTMISAPKNRTNFTSYAQFLDCLRALIQNFVSRFGRREVESWKFELWEDMRTEVYADKVSYPVLFKDVSDIIRKEAPGTKIGGSGNHLGWYRDHTERVVRKWGEAGIYPDFLTFNYYPYTAGDQYQERFSKRKYDESDLLHTLEELEKILEAQQFPKRKIFLTDWNMTISSRNFFNDSLWKGCYILKCYLESLGRADALFYSQLIDSTSDDVDTQTLINGSAGLLTRDLIEKPAFFAMKMLSRLHPRLVAVGDGYIITENEEKDISIILYNFINRNYLYYIKQEYENKPEDHYRYFETLEGKHFELELTGLMPSAVYVVRHDIVNREHGSVLDEWNALSCIEVPSREDLIYLKETCRPKKLLEYIRAENGCIRMECVLKPFEMRLITLERK